MSQQFEVKDSGERREFSTGARRDVDIGKPRYDLIPMTVLRKALKYRSEHLFDLDYRGIDEYEVKNLLMELAFSLGEGVTEDKLLKIIWIAIYQICHSENKKFDLVTRNEDIDGQASFDLIPICAYTRIAMLYGNGAIKYDPWNWAKGMDFSVFQASLMRHMFAVLQGETDEDHLAAVFFNAACILHFIEVGRVDELDDIGKRVRNWEEQKYTVKKVVLQDASS